MKKTVLVVDNDEGILDAITEILKSQEYKIFTAKSYKTILQVIYDHKPDIILLDINLQLEDGRLICRQLKDNPRTRDICIILFSGSPNKLENYEEYQANGILNKPFTIQELLNVFHSYCSESVVDK